MQRFRKIKTLAAALAIAVSPQMLHALPLSDYNLILSGDFHYSSSVWGHAIIGGNLTGNAVEFGTRLSHDSAGDTLTVLGDINSGDVKVQAGNAVYGGNKTANVLMNGGGTIRHDDSLDMSGILDELADASNLYKSRGATGAFSVLAHDNNKAVFNHTGSGDTAYFNVTADELLNHNRDLILNAGSAKTAIINVSGKDISALGAVKFGDGFRNASTNGLSASNVLWNFFEAEDLNLRNIDFYGSVLALNANVTNLGTLDGSLAAKSLISERQLHNEYFNPPSVVPLPASVHLILSGFALLMLGRLRARRSS